MTKILKPHRVAIVGLLVVFTLLLTARLLGEDQVSAGITQEPATTSSGWTGSRAPDFQLPTLDRGTVTLSDLKGKAVLLNFWATWCAPCKAEMPELERTYHEWQDKGLVVLAVNIQEDEKQVTNYVNDLQLTFPVALDKEGSMERLYRLQGIPTSFFIDEDGKISSVAYGALSRSAIEERVNKTIPNN